MRWAKVQTDNCPPEVESESKEFRDRLQRWVRHAADDDTVDLHLVAVEQIDDGVAVTAVLRDETTVTCVTVCSANPQTGFDRVERIIHARWNITKGLQHLQ